MATTSNPGGASQQPGTSSTKPTTSPLRLLVLTPAPRKTSPSLLPTSTPSPSLLPPLLQALTGISPSEDLATFSGYTSHVPLQLRTRYYAVDVGLWCDELPWPEDDLGGSHRSSRLQSGVEAGEAGESGTEQPSLREWREQMLGSEAVEVRGAIGAILLVLPFHVGLARADATTRRGVDVEADSHAAGPAGLGLSALGQHLEFVDAVNDLREAIEDDDYEREIVTIVLLQAPPLPAGKKTQRVSQPEIEEAAELLEEEWVETRAAVSWEFIGWDGVLDVTGDGLHSETNAQLNEATGGRGKTGIHKVIQALELMDWNASIVAADENKKAGFLSSDDDDTPDIAHDKEDGIKFQGQELEREMMGLKLAVQRQKAEDSDGDDDGVPEEEDIQVEQIQGIMERVVAIREAGQGMGKAERERFARREVERIMREMG